MNQWLFKIVIVTLIMSSGFLKSLPAQSLEEVFMHFSEQEMKIPLHIRQQMMDNKGNTMLNYDDYKLNIYDKRNMFLRVITPTETIYEIAAWKIHNKKELLVALCETHCGISCYSTIQFFLPANDWQLQPTENYIPELTVEDIFNEKKLEKNYLTPYNVIKDFKIKTQFLLPQTGHDIIVVFTCLDELDKSEYQRIHKYLDGVMLDLIWEKETFIKSKSYFSGN
ncbi:MAG TPA: DUF3256 family protein [Bacteroidales bacterium]|nr:DUF3256 family protein [Bacteroidales bacterium]